MGGGRTCRPCPGPTTTSALASCSGRMSNLTMTQATLRPATSRSLCGKDHNSWVALWLLARLAPSSLHRSEPVTTTCARRVDLSFRCRSATRADDATDSPTVLPPRELYRPVRRQRPEVREITATTSCEDTRPASCLVSKPLFISLYVFPSFFSQEGGGASSAAALSRPSEVFLPNATSESSLFPVINHVRCA